MKEYKSIFTVINNVLDEDSQVHTVLMNNGERCVHHGTFPSRKEADSEAENLHFYKLGTKVITHHSGLTRLAMRNPELFLKNVRGKLSEEEELEEAFKDYEFSKDLLNENLLLHLYHKYKENKNKKYFAVFYNNSAYDDGEFQSEGQWKFHSHHANLSDANGAKRTLGEFKSHDSPMNVRILDLSKDQLEIAKKKPHALMKHFEKKINGGNEEETKPLSGEESFKEWHRINKEKFKPSPIEHGMFNDYQDWARRERHQYLQKPAFKSRLEKVGLFVPPKPVDLQKLTKPERKTIETSHMKDFDPKDPWKNIKRYDSAASKKKEK